VSGSCEVIDELATKNQGEGFLVEEIVILARIQRLLFAHRAPPGPGSADESGLELLIPGMQDSDKA